MKDFRNFLNNISKLIVIFAIVGLATGCGSIADAGLDQAQAGENIVETPEPQPYGDNETDVDIITRDRP